MKYSKSYVGLYLVIASFLLSCATVPVTGRRQLIVVPNSTMLSMSFQQYDEFLKNNKLSNNDVQIQLVRTVGRKIQKAVEQYFSQENMSDALKNYDWEFNLVESPEINAWCMPGGKVVVYTGILPITKHETGLAVVMGHEVAHAVAKHGNERLSHGVATQLGGMGLTIALQKEPEKTRQLWMNAFGIGTQFGVILPYSRLHESEADHLGLIFMAMAGYHPQEAVGFWERMAEIKGVKAPPEIVSTHPSDETRIRKIKESLPTAMQYYEKSK
jgi:predicted Zn-dependent protease